MVFIPSLTGGSLQSDPSLAFNSDQILYLIRQNKHKLIRQSLSSAYSNISSTSYHRVFPLYNPASLDALVSWEIPSQKQSGHVLVSGLTLGAEHGDLGSIIEEGEG